MGRFFDVFAKKLLHFMRSIKFGAKQLNVPFNIVLFSKGVFLRTHCLISLLWVALFTLFYYEEIWASYEPCPLFGEWWLVVVWMVVRILGQKKSFLGLFQNWSGVDQEVLGHCYCLKMPIFGCIFSSKGRWLTSKIEIFTYNFNYFGKLWG